MRRALCYLLLASIALAMGVRTTAPVAEAHGIPDQTLAGDPGCIAAALKGEASSAAVLRQEVVPAAADIVGVDICVTVTTTATFNLALRPGTAASPGAVLNSATISSGATGTNWLHAEFTATTPVTPGSTYVIEITGIGALFKVRGTCGTTVTATCTTQQNPDMYPAGVTNVPADVDDFAFRTFAVQDNDLDGVNDGIDNCVGVYNPSQEHSDSNTTPLGAYGKSYNDNTWPYHDDTGDACDGDDDNDGLLDSVETGGPCGAPTDPTKRDSDGDLFIDSAECELGSNPNDALSKPANPAPGTDNDNDGLSNTFESTITSTNPNLSDTDGDKVSDGREFKFFGTTPLVANTDSDVCNDGKEVASINADQQVNAIDLGQIAQAFGTGPGLPYIPWFDITRDNSINAIDLGQVAQQFGPCL